MNRNSAESDPREDGQLVQAALDGDLPAFDRLVQRYQRQAIAVSYRLLNNRDDAMEVVQDAFLQAFRKLGTLDNVERFGSWLLRIVGNRSLNRRRSRALRKHASLEIGDADEGGEMSRPDPKADTPDEVASGEEVKEMLARAIEELPEMQRKALVLFAIEKHPQKDVAEMLGCSVEAVKWHVFTARKKLKEQFKGYL